MTQNQVYALTKMTIKNGNKSKEELIKYCETFYSVKKINDKQFEELMKLINE